MELGRSERTNDDVAAAAPAALDRISHGVGFDTTPIATALNWGVVVTLQKSSTALAMLRR
jgi:hypothetical protein